MTVTELKTKISNLETWLRDHPDHPNAYLVLNDKKALQLELNNLENVDSHE